MHMYICTYVGTYILLVVKKPIQDMDTPVTHDVCLRQVRRHRHWRGLAGSDSKARLLRGLGFRV